MRPLAAFSKVPVPR